MSSSAIVSNLQNINPSAIIELFSLQLDNNLHGATTVYRFHAGSSLKDNGEIVYFDRFSGTLARGTPRGEIQSMNISLNNISL